MAITLKQFNEAVSQNDAVQVDGQELFVAKVIGFVESTEVHSTNVTYRINDGTGVTECKIWIDKSGSSGSKHENIM